MGSGDMVKLPNPRRVKIHRNYTVEAAAYCLTVHKNTVRRWFREGLSIVSGRGRTLIIGSDLRAFLEARRAKGKCPCPPGHLYCLKCRTTRKPADGLTEYEAITPSSGNLKALCSICTTLMNRRIKRRDLGAFYLDPAVIGEHASLSLRERPEPSPIVHSR
jgi:hypothetical protein